MTRTPASGSRKHTGTPLPVPMRNRVTGAKPWDVPCPECKAQPGEPCLTANRTPMANPHATHTARKRMAARRVLEIVDSRAAAYVDSLTIVQREMARHTMGLSSTAVAAVLGTDTSTFSKLEKGRRTVHDTISAAYGALLRTWINQGGTK